MIHVEVANQQQSHFVDQQRLVSTAETILSDQGISTGEVSIALVDSARMQQLNRQYLDHDYPTDVLSFPLEQGEPFSGEVVLCTDVAAEAATRYGWQFDDELLLYLIHGVLHLVGFNDKTESERVEMRDRERHYLSLHKLTPRYDEEAPTMTSKGDQS